MSNNAVNYKLDVDAVKKEYGELSISATKAINYFIAIAVNAYQTGLKGEPLNLPLPIVEQKGA